MMCCSEEGKKRSIETLIRKSLRKWQIAVFRSLKNVWGFEDWWLI